MKAIEATCLLLEKLRGRSIKRAPTPGYSVIVWAGSKRAPRFVTYCADRDATLDDHAVIVRGLVDPQVQLEDGEGVGGTRPVEMWGLTAAKRCDERRSRSQSSPSPPGPLNLVLKERCAARASGKARAAQ